MIKETILDSHPVDPKQRALEIALGERILSRLKTQLLVVFVGSFLLAALIASSLVWEYHALSALSDSRISEYRLLVTEKLEELHRLDLEEVALRTRPQALCDTPLSQDDAASLLESELGRPPRPEELAALLEAAASFGVCDIGEVRHTLDDAVNVARVDTVYRLLLGRPAEPIGAFIYGYWLASGVPVEAVGRDIMTSPEFQSLKRLAGNE